MAQLVLHVESVELLAVYCMKKELQFSLDPRNGTAVPRFFI